MKKLLLAAATTLGLTACADYDFANRATSNSNMYAGDGYRTSTQLYGHAFQLSVEQIEEGCKKVAAQNAIVGLLFAPGFVPGTGLSAGQVLFNVASVGATGALTYRGAYRKCENYNFGLGFFLDGEDAVIGVRMSPGEIELFNALNTRQKAVASQYLAAGGTVRSALRDEALLALADEEGA